MTEIELKKKSRKVSLTRRPPRIFLILMDYCGFPIGVILALPYEDIKSNEALINIWKGMGAKYRWVPLASLGLTEICKYHRTINQLNIPLKVRKEGGTDMDIWIIRVKTMAHYMPNGNDIGVIYAYIV